MSLPAIKQVTGKGVYIPGDDIDTDRIIPARFMKCVTFDGLGEFMFYDVRHDPQGNKRKHNLNDPRFAEASIIISGNNFGCGSSREHAPQAIAKAGFKAVIAEGYAEIFFGNSTQLGIPCVAVSAADRAKLAAAVEADPSVEITVDVDKLEVRFGGQSVPCTMREANRDALLSGRWDPISDLIAGAEEVAAVAAKLTYMQ
ncbi:MAG: 3-isopropylmalate dehydratase small subunit [Opitutales bacterium]|nr:3-isopropylmalate dehydratase small subunit [Opitutales bacterium]